MNDIKRSYKLRLDKEKPAGMFLIGRVMKKALPAL
jgi:hypothetical protein